MPKKRFCGRGAWDHGGIAKAAQRDRLIAERALIEKFRALYGAQHWYFLPQYAGDMESIARQQSEGLANDIASYDDIASGRLAERVRQEYQQRNR